MVSAAPVPQCAAAVPQLSLQKFIQIKAGQVHIAQAILQWQARRWVSLRQSFVYCKLLLVESIVLLAALLQDLPALVTA